MLTKTILFLIPCSWISAACDDFLSSTLSQESESEVSAQFYAALSIKTYELQNLQFIMIYEELNTNEL